MSQGYLAKLAEPGIGVNQFGIGEALAAAGSNEAIADIAGGAQV
jgi:hypothetical protein